MSRRTRRAAADPASASEPAVSPSEATATAPSPGSLAALTGLGAMAALWALFLWGELVRARAGARPFCPLSDEAGCTAVWDSAFAAAVHRLSGLPIAGWGVVWGVAAFVLPLAALARLAQGRPAPALVSAIRVTAGAGLVTVFVMTAVSAAERAFCSGCAVTYLVVAGYAGTALFGWQRLGLPEAGRGVALAAATVVLGFVCLLYPGMRTPRGAHEEALAAVAAAPASPTPSPSGPAPDVPAGDPLPAFVQSLVPKAKQALSDALGIYRSSPEMALPPPRFLIGSKDAPVRITEFTDVLCDHCADLHETLLTLGQHLPEGSFSIEPREFPLDGNCNPVLPRRGPETVRCLAAKARICLAGHQKYRELAGALYHDRKALTRDRVLELASRYSTRAAVQACVDSPATRKRLEEDVAIAARYQPEGTPLVLINGRKAVSFGPFLYAIVLSRGNPRHPAFEGLPPPDPNAHLH